MREPRRPVTAVFLLAIALGLPGDRLPPPVRPESPSATFPITVECAEAGLTGRPGQPVPGRNDLRREPLVTREEIEQLVRTLERVPSESGFAVRGADAPTLVTERLAVVTGDVMGALAAIHAREMLGMLRQFEPGADRNALERNLRGIEPCVRSRFQERGGRDAFDRTRQLVLKYREPLERVFLAHAGGAPERPR